MKCLQQNILKINNFQPTKRVNKETEDKKGKIKKISLDLVKEKQTIPF